MKKSISVSIFVLVFVLTAVFNPAAAEEKDKYGGIFKNSTSKSPRIFGDPVKIRAADQEAAGPALEFLIMEKRGTLEHIPQLATSWEISPDSRTYTFNLRKGVKFHDGTDFNAQAVKFNLEMWKDNPGPDLQTMESIEVIDDHTIRINFSSFDALIMNDLATEAYMVSPSAYEKNGAKWMETNPVGTGPFRFKKYERDVILSYEKNNDYWQKGRPYLDGYDLVIIKDAMTQIAALKAGEIHAILAENREAVPGLIKDGFQLIKQGGPGVGLYGDSINPDSPWAKKKVREAIEYAIDKESIMDELGLGFPKVLYQLVPADDPMFDPSLKPRKYDPEMAKKLLAEAGYPNGLKTTITHMAHHWPESWVAIQSYLSKVGITVELVPVDRPKYLQIRFEGGLKNGASHILTDQVTTNFLAGLSGGLLTSAKNAPDMLRPQGFDKLIEQAVVEPDAAKRKEMMVQAQKLIYNDVSFIPINQEIRLMVVSPSVRDWDPNVYAIPVVEALTNTWLAR